MTTAAKILAVLAAAAIFGGLPFAFFSSSGEPADLRLGAPTIYPDGIEVATAADLAHVATGAEFPTGSGIIWSEESTYYMTADITLTGQNNHEPMLFNGIFDGNGYTIRGLDARDNEFSGLFSKISYAKVKNVVLEDVNISGNHAGGIVGALYNFDSAVIENCSVSGYISGHRAGGIVGGALGDVGSALVSSCMNRATIDSYAAGGILGHAFNGYVMIKDCYNVGIIIGEYVPGGIAGDIKTTDAMHIVNCYNIGKVISTSLVGNIIGDSMQQPDDPVMVNCYAPPGMLYTGATQAADVLFGGSLCRIDGVSTPLRTADQSSSIKTVAQMTPTLATAKTGASIYYTGVTIVSEPVGSTQYAGWDFVNVWTINPDVNNGYPTLRAFTETDPDTDDGNRQMFQWIVVILAIVLILLVIMVII
jgi:hypothetical protein